MGQKQYITHPKKPKLTRPKPHYKHHSIKLEFISLRIPDNQKPKLQTTKKPVTQSITGFEW